MTVHATLRVIQERPEERDLPRLVTEAKAGTPGAFDRLARAIERRVHGWAHRIAVDHDEADDITQDVLIKLERALPTFIGGSRFSTWLYRITRNAALQRRRSEHRHAGPSIDSLAIEGSMHSGFVVPADADSVDDGVVAQAVLECFERLPQRQRQIFELADIKGLSAVEIAAQLGMKPVTVRASLFKARRTIRTRMLEQHPDLLREYLS
jgi:RNA polymerase sigma-70 factor (ECF subfamily)